MEVNDHRRRSRRAELENSNLAVLHYVPHAREYENRGEFWTFRFLSNEQPCFEDPLWIYLLISNSLAAPRHEAFRERMGEDPLSP
jgi:hypothetical protein